MKVKTYYKSSSNQDGMVVVNIDKSISGTKQTHKNIVNWSLTKEQR